MKKSTGITRKVDELGRIVIPKEMRKALDYDWGFESRLNDLNKQFVDICGNMFNKDEIVSVIVQDNPLHKEPEKEEV